MGGDNVRHGLCGGLGFSVEVRSGNTRRIGEVGKLFIWASVIVLVAFISPIKRNRDLRFAARQLWISARRQTQGLYQRAKRARLEGSPESHLLMRTLRARN